MDEDTQNKDENGDSGEGDDGDSDNEDDTTQLVVEHIHCFAQEMRREGQGVVVVEDEDIACDPNDTTSVEDNNEAAINTEQLMSYFCAILSATSIDEIQ
eukprot:5320053-Ditylum_brightwellii.AAC.1